jgi:hypothetical protein
VPRGKVRTVTAVAEPGTGWDRHEYRPSGLTHLGKGGASLLMLMAKSRHRKPENVRNDLHPSPDANAEMTSWLAPVIVGADPRPTAAGRIA